MAYRRVRVRYGLCWRGKRRRKEWMGRV